MDKTKGYWYVVLNLLSSHRKPRLQQVAVCGVCGKEVWPKLPVLCTQCGKWIHNRCSGVKGNLESCKNFKCRKCLNVVASVVVSDSKAESRLNTTVGLKSVEYILLPW